MQVRASFSSRIIFVFTVYFFSFINSSDLSAQNGRRIPPEKPKLVIGITVSQMRYDYISRYWNKFGEDGFKKLIGEGAFCRNVRYNYLFTQTAPGMATIATGALPAVHGIIADEWYDKVKKVAVKAASDEKAKAVGGSYEFGFYSPHRMVSSTVSDELRFASPQSRVVSIALDPEPAILAGGHSANAAYWFDPANGGWMSSSWYMDSLPQWVAAFNNKKIADVYLSEIWNPLLPIDQYSESLPDKNEYEKGIQGQIIFPYDLNKLTQKKKEKRNYDLLRYVPAGNMYTKDFAINVIMNDSLGLRNVTDMLFVTFTATGNAGALYGNKSVEIEDLFLRLDRDIAHFLNFVEETIGRENVLVFLTADRGIAYIPGYLEQSKVPSGVFNANQAMALLSSYLNILYGKADWISYYKNQQLYLNQQLIEDSKLSLEQFQTTSANFLVQFTGVANAVTASTLQQSNFTSGILWKIQNNYNQKRSGDVILHLEPGWIEKSENGTTANSSWAYDSHVPLVWYGWKIRRQNINTMYDPTCIAPTISVLLDIMFPNGSAGNTVMELLQ
ncbi:MAG: alkaline phosphatase family protein [Bacteroidales bacterium]